SRAPRTCSSCPGSGLTSSWSVRHWSPAVIPVPGWPIWSPLVPTPPARNAERRPRARTSSGGTPLSETTDTPGPDVPEVPNKHGHFDQFGGKFVPEALHAAIGALEDAFTAARQDPEFTAELDRLLSDYAGRPSPISEAANLSSHAGGARILLKREDLNHTGSHKINNVLGQALLARRMGKTRVIAETGAGQHGVAT